MKKIAIRDAYGEALKRLGAENERIVALEADVGGSTKSALFGKEFPDRYFQVGISELNMVNMAAGMARAGLIPFVNTFSAFLSTRASDPIVSMIGYDHMNVKLAGTYVGLSDSYDGASHHAITDISFVRAIPGMVVLTPSDAVMTEKAVRAAAAYEGPVYMRLSRAAAPVIYEESLDFAIGKGIRVREGADVTIVVTGTLLGKALAAADILAGEGIAAEVIDLHTVKPIDENLLTASAKKTGAVVTFEEHSICGGLYGAVSETLARLCPVPADGIGAMGYAESGDYEDLLAKYGYTPEALAAKAKAVIARKAQ